MSDTTQDKPEWELKREGVMAARQKVISERDAAMQHLTEEQRKAIDTAYSALNTANDNLQEMQDLYLSDISRINEAFWAMHHAFNKGVM